MKKKWEKRGGTQTLSAFSFKGCVDNVCVCDNIGFAPVTLKF